ncbi:MAG: hypothetical protein JST00_41665 [Deltaproteobacteria bacterium]|nr:hypothetical protein [Deltaproteobacteria bacterium]
MAATSRTSMFAAAAITALTSFTASPARADARTVPLSSLNVLPTLAPVRASGPAAVTVPGLTMKVKDSSRGAKWHDITAATGRGYCLAASDTGTRFMDTTGMSSTSEHQELDLNRLFEKDGKTMFERTRISLDGKTSTITAVGRAVVELSEVARGPEGLVVWGYRTASDVVVIAKRAERGTESSAKGGDDGVAVPFVFVEGCPYAAARLDTKKPDVGAFAQLVGSLPAKGTGKDQAAPKFLVDASLSKLVRDPEPMVAVRVRVRD